MWIKSNWIVLNLQKWFLNRIDSLSTQRFTALVNTIYCSIFKRSKLIFLSSVQVLPGSSSDILSTRLRLVIISSCCSSASAFAARRLSKSVIWTGCWFLRNSLKTSQQTVIIAIFGWCLTQGACFLSSHFSPSYQFHTEPYDLKMSSVAK